jgi:hypothetical protein
MPELQTTGQILYITESGDDHDMGQTPVIVVIEQRYHARSIQNNWGNPNYAFKDEGTTERSSGKIASSLMDDRYQSTGII